MADITRRSFFAGMGSITVGFLFARKLDRVLGELEAESFAEEPQEAGQLANAVIITCMLQSAFRPQRLVVRGKKVGTRMVEEKIFHDCEHCEGRGWNEDEDDRYPLDCKECGGTGGELQATGKMVEEDVLEYPWIIEDLSINRKSQFIDGAGGVPASVFAAGALDAEVMMDVAAPGCEMQFKVRYTGSEPDGEVFQAALLGRSLDGGKRMMMLPISSVDRVCA